MNRAGPYLFAFLLLAAPTCRSGGQDATPERRTEALEITGKNGRLLATIQAEVVSTPEATAQGLMFREEVPPGTGMFFVFPRDEVRSFWMKNTLVSLDMIFIDSEGLIVGIRRNTTPRSEDSVTVGLPSRYVLEVAAGTCSERGIHRGAKLSLPFK